MSQDAPESAGDTVGSSPGSEATLDEPDQTTRPVAGGDDRFIEILSWVLDTETRARIYVYLRKHPHSTSEEVAQGTELYPSTVREALAGLTDDNRVTRRKRQHDGAGNNPYEYTAIPSGELVADVVDDVEAELNTLCELDAIVGEQDPSATEPVSVELFSESPGVTEPTATVDSSEHPSNPKR